MGEEAADVFGTAAATAGGEGIDLADELVLEVDTEVGGAGRDGVGGHRGGGWLG
jgi:hypothetical protein